MGMPVPEGSDMVAGSVIRPRIGGGTKRRKQNKRNKRAKRTRKQSGKQRGKQSGKQRGKQSGGFIPTVMEGFCMAASKYITPLALFAGYKWMTRSKKK
jgi:type II secretory pathway pseudopilin PulG